MTTASLEGLRERIASLLERATSADERVSKAIGDSFSPPEGVRSAAARGLELRAKWKRGGLSNEQASEQGIGSGVQRAVNLKNGDAISLATVRRMHGFFSRHAKNYAPDKRESDGGPTAGTIAWLLWGGNAGKAWADGIISRAESVRKDGEGVASSTAPSAGPDSSDVHVPGPIGGSNRREASVDKTPAPKKKKPEPVAKLSDPILTALKRKVEETNDGTSDASKRTDLATLKAVYSRGVAAYNAEKPTGASQGAYALGRVNAYLKLLRSGRPENKAYVGDNDLLPSGHPRATKKD